MGKSDSFWRGRQKQNKKKSQREKKVGMKITISNSEKNKVEIPILQSNKIQHIPVI